jgi:NADH dehydrogenase FAD-containing subunit
MATHNHNILIVGGGFAGIRLARQLTKQQGLEITLVSDRPTFAYYPQLYHAATGGSRSEASLPLTGLLKGSRVRIVQDKAMALDVAGRTLTGSSGQKYAYDELILALGSVTNYFGIEGLKEFAYDIKTIEGAEAFKAHLHHQLVELHKTELNYVVIGAGPTGIELSAALGQYLHRIVRLHGIKRPHYRIDLIEAAPRILPRSSLSYATKVERRLKKLGVKIMTGTAVLGETVDALQLKGESIKSHTVVWTSGVANNPFFHDNAHSFELAKNGRVVVNDHMEAAENIYVIGDNASSQYGGLAETAVNDANFVARDIYRKLHHGSRPAYKQKAPASVIPVGSGWAAAQIGKLAIYGYAGWIIRRFADLIAYRDIEPTSRALGVWLKETTHEDDCPICLQNRAA